MTVNLSLWKQTTYADGSHPIVIVVRNKKARRVIQTGIRALPSQWDDKRKTVNSKHPEYRRAQIHLEKSLLDLKYNLLNAKAQGKSIDDVVRSGQSGESFIDFGVAHIEKLRRMGRVGNARVYEGALNALRKFMGDAGFNEITYDALCRFRDLKIASGMKATGINSYLRTLRALWNLAEPDLPYPFKKGLLLTEPRRMVRAHDLDDLRKIFDYKAPDEWPAVAVAVEIWKLGFLFRGMDSVDLLSLQYHQLRGSHLVYERRKTGQQLKVKILPQARAIIEALHPNDGRSLPYGLHEIKTDDDLKLYRSRYRSLSRRLEAVGKVLELDVKITTKTCRFSFATAAKHLGIGSSVIREMMGHEDKSTTGLYLDRHLQADIDKAHEAVVGLVTG